MTTDTDTVRRTYPVWLLRLVPPIRSGRPLSALLLGLISTALFWWAGVFGADSGSIPGEAQAAAAYFCFLVAYLPTTLHFIVERTETSFDRVLPALPMQPARLPSDIARLRRSIRHKSRIWVAGNIALGLSLWLVQSWFLAGGFSGIWSSVTAGRGSMMMVLGPLPVWVFTTCTIGVMVNNARLFRRLARLVICDVYNTEPLMAFGSMAVSALLLVIGLQASFSILWLGGIDSPWAIAPGLIITIVAMIYLLFAPITPLHRRLAAAKVRALAELQRSIDQVRSPTFDASNPDQIRQLADLIALRTEVSRVRQWPFAMGVVARLGLYLVIVPLTWVGAALIEMLVDAVLV